MSLVVVGF